MTLLDYFFIALLSSLLLYVAIGAMDAGPELHSLIANGNQALTDTRGSLF